MGLRDASDFDPGIPDDSGSGMIKDSGQGFRIGDSRSRIRD